MCWAAWIMMTDGKLQVGGVTHLIRKTQTHLIKEVGSD